MTNPLTQLAHLARRFVGHVRARPLSPAEQDDVSAALPAELATLFFRQSAADQRHAVIVAGRLRAQRPDDDDAFAAALVHDVGKADAPIGPIQRSLATTLEAAHLPLPPSWQRYRRHGEIGAQALEAAGAPLIAVTFARHHPGPAPAGVDADAWLALTDADHT